MSCSRLVVTVGVAVVLFSCTRAQQAVSPGKLDCPCATPEWESFSVLAAAVANSEYPSNYGLEGCKAYDFQLNATGCSGGQDKPGYCNAQWCYVDTSRCAVDRDDCESNGLAVGTKQHSSCRSRPVLQSTLIPAGYYSYETCGYLNSYDVSRASEVIGGRVLIGAATHDAPYVSVETRPGLGNDSVTVYSGVEYTFLSKALDAFDADVELVMEDGWATAESREKFSSSYTACVHDVAIGNFDICIGDFWVTSERMLMTIFLPSFRTDIFYLVVFDDAQYWGFDELLRNPFKPFSNEAWALIAGVVAFKSLVEAVLDFAEEEDAGAARSPYSSRCFTALYMAWLSVFSGNSRFKGNSLPAQVSNMGWQLFLLIVVASYKANLAKMLILRNTGPTIASIDEAIEHRLKICIPSAIETTIRLNYPNGDYFVYGGSTGDFARLMQGGECEAAVIHQKRIDQMHAGWIHAADCKKVHEGTLTEGEGRCEVGHGNKERNDCDIQRVGDVLLSIPIAFPISSDPEMVNPMSWAITQVQNSGEWEAAVISNSHLFPESYCDSEFTKNRRLGKEAFAAGSFFVALGVALAVGLRFWQRRTPEPAPSSAPSEPRSDSEPPLSPKSRAMLDKIAELADMVRSNSNQGHDNFEVLSHVGVLKSTSGPAAPASSHVDWRPMPAQGVIGSPVVYGAWQRAATPTAMHSVPAQTQAGFTAAPR